MVNLGECISFGVDQLKKNPMFHIVGCLIILIAANVTAGILAGPLIVGYYGGIRKELGGGKAEIGDIFAGFDRLTPALIAAVIGLVAIMIGSILCIIPGLIAATVMYVTYYIILDGEDDGVQAFKTAWERVKPQVVMATITMIVLTIVGALGAIACGIGVLVTMPIAYAGFYKLSEQLSGGQTSMS